MKTQPTPREKASQLVNEYARKQAALDAATADTRADITTLTAALNQASAPFRMELANLEQQAKELALAYGPEIFGTKRSLVENGYKLALTATDEVEIDGGEDAACMRIRRALAAVGTSDDDTSRNTRLALNACLNITMKINRTYVKAQYDDYPEFFESHGLRLVAKDSASLNKAPPPREAKAKKKASKLQTAKKVEEQEAAA